MTDDLDRALGYRFRDRALLEQALTHASYANEAGLPPSAQYDRLEFLGDAVLGLVLAEREFHEDPQGASGVLSIRRARLARLAALAGAGERLGLGAHARLSAGERSQGGTARRRLLADLYEAVVGAIYLDGGMEAARGFVLSSIVEGAGGSSRHIDAKSALQELLQGQGRPAPVYRVMEQAGPAHEPAFLVACVIEESIVGQGVGGSRKEAEQAAARVALRELESGSARGGLTAAPLGDDRA